MQHKRLQYILVAILLGVRENENGNFASNATYRLYLCNDNFCSRNTNFLNTET